MYSYVMPDLMLMMEMGCTVEAIYQYCTGQGWLDEYGDPIVEKPSDGLYLFRCNVTFDMLTDVTSKEETVLFEAPYYLMLGQGTKLVLGESGGNYGKRGSYWRIGGPGGGTNRGFVGGSTLEMYNSVLHFTANNIYTITMAGGMHPKVYIYDSIIKGSYYPNGSSVCGLKLAGASTQVIYDIKRLSYSNFYALYLDISIATIQMEDLLVSNCYIGIISSFDSYLEKIRIDNIEDDEIRSLTSASRHIRVENPIQHFSGGDLMQIVTDGSTIQELFVVNVHVSDEEENDLEDVAVTFVSPEDDDTELHTYANAVSDPNENEADAMTGWTCYNWDVCQSQSSEVNVGNYAFLAHNTISPDPPQGLLELDIFSFITPGKYYIMSFDARHIGEGSKIRFTLNDVAGPGPAWTPWWFFYLYNTMTEWKRYSFLFMGKLKGTKLLQIATNPETGQPHDGGFYLDNFSLKEAYGFGPKFTDYYGEIEEQVIPFRSWWNIAKTQVDYAPFTAYFQKEGYEDLVIGNMDDEYHFIMGQGVNLNVKMRPLAYPIDAKRY